MMTNTALTAVDIQHLRRAIQIAHDARSHGNHPFGSVLADEHGHLLLEAENTVNTERDCTGHAETNLVRLASRQLSPEQLAHTTLYTSIEPCAMCAGAIHWAGIPRIVYALSEEGLYALTSDTADKLLLPCREVFARAGRPIEVIGPALEDEALAVHEDFWT